MKKIRRITLIIVLGAMTAATTGCFGEFALTRNVYTWNDDVSGSRFVKTLVFWGLNIIPVYGVVGFGDLIIFNLIEFWTGSNPLAMADGECDYQLVMHEGELYELSASKNQFSVSKVNGSKSEHLTTFNFHESSQLISVLVNDKQYMLAEYHHN